MRRSVVFKTAALLDMRMQNRKGRRSVAGKPVKDFDEPEKNSAGRFTGPLRGQRLGHMVGVLIQFPVIMLLALGSGAGASERSAALPAGDDPLFRRHPKDEPRAVSEPAMRPARRAPGATLLPRLSSRFGYRRDPFHGGLKMHDGIDIPGPLGSPIRAADSGVVRFAGRAGGYGNMMEIMHADDLATRYGHLSRMLVRAGARVRRGDIIALMGSTGRSTGSHLHFEVRAHGQIVDPLREFGPTPAPKAAPQDIRPPYLSAFARGRLETADAPGIR